MKTWLWSASFIIFAIAASAQDNKGHRERTVVDRGPHHTRWRWLTELKEANGQSKKVQHEVVELATGLNYSRAGGWVPSSEQIELFGNGAVARQGQYQIIFGPNLNAAGSVDVLAPDGKRFQSRVWGLVYVDSVSGESVLIAETQDAQGHLLPPNQVFYLDAFAGTEAALRADVRYTYRKASFEQDIILRTKLAPPSFYGLPDQTSRLEVWTEFFDPPTAVKQRAALKVEHDPGRRQAMAIPDLVDTQLDFGRAQVGSGRAFMVEGGRRADDTVPVAKDWVVIQEPGAEARTFLIEALEYSNVESWVNTLPDAQAALKQKPAPGVLLARRHGNSRAELMASVTSKNAKPPPGKQVAKLDVRPSLNAANQQAGFLIDYAMLDTSLTNYTFKASETYHITAPVYLYGTNNLLEGGAVIKFDPDVGATIDIKGTLRCDTDLYRPAVLTARDDDSVGEWLSWDFINGTYADTALNFDFITSGKAAALQNIRILHATTGVRFSGGTGHELRHIQMVNCGVAVKADGAQYAMRNVLGWNLTNALTGSASTGLWEHATLDGVTNLISSVTGRFTNCLLTTIGNTNGLTGLSNVVLSSSAGIYKTVGGGHHYLADSSPYRNLGTANVNSNLTKELKLRTTWAPVLLSDITVDTTLFPQAGRDTNQLDLGFHYAPLDYFGGGINVSSNVTVQALGGVALGFDYSTSSWGLILKNAKFISIGDPVRINYIGRAHTSQELSGGNPGERACFYDALSSNLSRESEVRLRFSEFTQLANDGYMIYVGTKFGALEWTHSRVYNASLVVNVTGSGTLVCGATNTLWEGGGAVFGLGPPAGSGVTTHLRNNLWRGLSLHFIGGNSTWSVRDDLYDSMLALSDHGNALANSHNAYFQTTYDLTGGTSVLNLGSLTYQQGVFGRYYQPTNSALTNKGSRTADLASLYHFTTATNQIKEANSIVDIGLHYVAANAQGQPLDTDSDGVPDYQEDANGNGVSDSNETDWTVFTVPFKVFITNPSKLSVLP